MNTVVSDFSGLLSDSAMMERLLMLLIVVIAFLVIWAVSVISMNRLDPVRRRLYHVVDDANGPSGTLAARIAKLFDNAETYITPRDAKERWTAQERLLHAGYRAPSAVNIFYGIKAILLLGLPTLTLVLMPLLTAEPIQKIALWVMGAAGMGMVLPSYVLDKKIAKRQLQVTNAFPDALDLLVVCSEAGLGLSGALIRVAVELESSHPILAEELSIVNAEMRAGVERVTALQGLAQRTGIVDIRGLVGLLAQSLQLGSSIADMLRIYSEEFRDKRMQRAEEQAAKLGTKMIFPMLLCFFPGIFVVAIGPAALKLMNVFAGLNH